MFEPAFIVIPVEIVNPVPTNCPKVFVKFNVSVSDNISEDVTT